MGKCDDIGWFLSPSPHTPDISKEFGRSRQKNARSFSNYKSLIDETIKILDIFMIIGGLIKQSDESTHVEEISNIFDAYNIGKENVQYMQTRHFPGNEWKFIRQ